MTFSCLPDVIVLQATVRGSGGVEEEFRTIKIDGDYVREVMPSGRVLEQWFLHCLEVCEPVIKDEGEEDGRVALAVEFNSIRSKGSHDKRVYFMEREDADRMQEVARPVLEALARHTLRLGALQCVKCQTEFTNDGYVGRKEGMGSEVQPQVT